jgi:hypothetical protein
MIKTKKELLDHLASVGYTQSNYEIAVEALIFTPEGKLLLEKRGPQVRDEVGKLEGVGGRLDDDKDLLEQVQEEIRTELGADQGGVKVNIEQLLEVRQVQFDDLRVGEAVDWVVVSYLCRLSDGVPHIGEPHKIESLHELTLDELYAADEADLSRSVIMGRRAYRAKYGNRPYYELQEEGE